MPTLYDLKPRFQALWRPLVGRLAAWGVTPNQVTLLAFALSCGLGLALALRPDLSALWLALPAWMFFRMALNAIDGMLAREHDGVTPLGGMLNELTDPLADAALMLPLALVPGISPVAVVVAVVLAQATELAGVAAVQVGASRRYDGPFGKSDRAMVFGAIGGLIGLGVSVGPAFTVALWAAAALTAWTVVRRVRAAVAELEAG